MITRVPPGVVRAIQFVCRACTRVRRPFGPFVGAYCIRPRPYPGAGSFAPARIRLPNHSPLSGRLGGVCDTPLHGLPDDGQLPMITRVPPGSCVQFNSCAGHVPGRARPFGPFVGAYRIRPPSHSSPARTRPPDHSPLSGRLEGVCDTPLHGRGGDSMINYQ